MRTPASLVAQTPSVMKHDLPKRRPQRVAADSGSRRAGEVAEEAPFSPRGAGAPRASAGGVYSCCEETRVCENRDLLDQRWLWRTSS